MGALGCGISGSGPTIFAICESKTIAKKIMDFSKNFYKTCGINCDVYISKVNHTGPKYLNEILQSTNNKDLNEDFRTALFKGMPSDKGLYMPHFYLIYLSYLIKKNVFSRGIV